MPSQVAAAFSYFFQDVLKVAPALHLLSVRVPYGIMRGTGTVAVFRPGVLWQFWATSSWRRVDQEYCIGGRYMTDSPELHQPMYSTVQSLSQVLGVLAFNWFVPAFQD